jgi:hypothetical protein
MASTSKDNTSFLPNEVKKEIDSEQLQNKSHLKAINAIDLTQLSSFNVTSKMVTDSTSANVLFTTPIKVGSSFNPLTGGSKVTFSNLGNVSSTTVLSAIYEHVRGYLYRDFGASGDIRWNTYLTSPASVLNGVSGQLIVSKSSGSGLTAVRFWMMNRKFFGDRISPGSLRIDVLPLAITYVGKIGLDFKNDDQINSTSGDWAAATAQPGLVGSLLNRGIRSQRFSNAITMNQKNVTGFTIAMRVKFVNAGPTLQTLIHRRVGNPSLTAYGNSVVTQRYSDFTQPIAIISPTSFAYSFSATTVQVITGGTSSVLTITNAGSSQIYYSLGTSQLGGVDYSSYLKFVPWTAWLYNPGFSATGTIVNTNNGLTGWSLINGTQFNTGTDTGFSHGNSGGFNTYWTTHGKSDYLVIDTVGVPTTNFIYKRLTSTSGTYTFAQQTPAYAIANGSDKIIIHFNMVISGGDINSGGNAVTSSIIATELGGAPNSSSAITISSFASNMFNPAAVSAISLTCILSNGVDRKFDHKGIDLWLSIGDSHSSAKYYGIGDFRCEYVPATIYAGGNASATAYFDSSVTAVTIGNAWADIVASSNHPWLQNLNLPQFIPITYDTTGTQA